MNTRRNRRSGVEDLWKSKRTGGRTKLYGQGKRWRARHVDDTGQEHTKRFGRKTDAQEWLDDLTASHVVGTYVDPKTAQITVSQWCEQWIESYKVNRTSTVRQARVHIAHINDEFGSMRLNAVKPSMVKAWTATLQKKFAASTVYAIHSRLNQIMGDAVHDGLIAVNPCSRRTSPPMGKPKVYVITDAQVWAIHDAVPEHLRPAILLGAFAGLRIGEAAGLRTTDVDFMRDTITPAHQYPAEPLKTEAATWTIPIAHDLSLALSAAVKQWPGDYIVTNGVGGQCGPWFIERAIRNIKPAIDGLHPNFSFHDLRHYYASTLINAGAPITAVQHAMRHENATTTLRVYSHLMPNADSATRSAITEAMAKRAALKPTAY